MALDSIDQTHFRVMVKKINTYVRIYRINNVLEVPVMARASKEYLRSLIPAGLPPGNEILKEGRSLGGSIRTGEKPTDRRKP